MNPPLFLLADSGATKTTWALLSAKRKKLFHSTGISPYFLSPAQIKETLEREVLPALQQAAAAGPVSRIYFYGTGLAEPEHAALLKGILETVFPGTEVSVGHDLLAAAHGLCGHEAGIACILGTGSGSCYFDGELIRKIRPGLGFILGDEGSGAFLGRMVVQAYLYGHFGGELRTRFEEKYEAARHVILENVYKKPSPNRYLASFSLFLAENRGDDRIEHILTDGIGKFFLRHVSEFTPEIHQHPVHFTGGVAWAYRDILATLCRKCGVRRGRILKEPMEGLIRYHRSGMQNIADGKK
jgi:N-acetylglucosamine kinase-like BadF-type ATPase